MKCLFQCSTQASERTQCPYNPEVYILTTRNVYYVCILGETFIITISSVRLYLGGFKRVSNTVCWAILYNLEYIHMCSVLKHLEYCVFQRRELRPCKFPDILGLTASQMAKMRFILSHCRAILVLLPCSALLSILVEGYVQPWEWADICLDYSKREKTEYVVEEKDHM